MITAIPENTILLTVVDGKPQFSLQPGGSEHLSVTSTGDITISFSEVNDLHNINFSLASGAGTFRGFFAVRSDTPSPPDPQPISQGNVPGTALRVLSTSGQTLTIRDRFRRLESETFTYRLFLQNAQGETMTVYPEIKNEGGMGPSTP